MQNINSTERLRKARLFQIPNPYDEIRPDKDEWFSKAADFDKKIADSRKTVDEMLKQHKDDLLRKNEDEDQVEKQRDKLN